jgi:hypothetical protein
MSISPSIVFWLIVILLCVYLLTRYIRKTRQEAKRKKYKWLRNNSCGSYDDRAQAALREIDSMEVKTSDDDFAAGNIIELNKHQGDLREAPGVDEVDIIRHYQNALADIRDNPGTDRDIPPMFIVDYIGGFIDRNANELMTIPAGYQFVGFYAGTAPKIQHVDINTRKQQAASESSNKIEYIEKFIDSGITHTNDMQNVHDSAVNNSLRRTFANLKSSTVVKPNNTCIEEAIAFLNEYKISPEKKSRALRALDTISTGNYNSTLGATDTEVFAMVWSRADAGENAHNATRIREAVIDALADSFDPLRDPDGKIIKNANGEIEYNKDPVCVGGRCGRLLESLVLLDHDDRVGGAQTLEQHKNDIMESVKKALQHEIENAKNSSDPDMKAVGMSYEDPSVETKPEAERQFRETVQREIDAIIDSKRDLLGSAADRVKQEAYAAIS